MSFHGFRGLPTEIRDHIWGLALENESARRLVFFDLTSINRPDDYGHIYPIRDLASPLLSTSRESRRNALQYYNCVIPVYYTGWSHDSKDWLAEGSWAGTLHLRLEADFFTFETSWYGINHIYQCSCYDKLVHIPLHFTATLPRSEWHRIKHAIEEDEYNRTECFKRKLPGGEFANLDCMWSISSMYRSDWEVDGHANYVVNTLNLGAYGMFEEYYSSGNTLTCEHLTSTTPDEDI